MNSASEDAFESVLKSCKNIENFLDSFFCFLAKRTDFFVEYDKEKNYGFPKGYTENLLLKKYSHWKTFVESPSSEEKAKAKESVESCSKGPEKDLTKEKFSNIKNVSCENSSECYNGQRTKSYCWSQSISDIDVKVRLPPEVKDNKKVIVNIQTNSIEVLLNGTKEPLVEGKLCHPIRKSDSGWYITPGESINLWLQKSSERWWTALLTSEDPIEMSQVEAVKPMEDLSQEEQMKIREMMWNNEQKMKGLPTTDDLKVQSVLKDAWNAEGSPFKGTPFDPSVLGSSNEFPGPTQGN